MAVYPIKKFVYKRKTYKFKEPLKIYINDFLANDLKTKFSEFSIPSINDGYSSKPIVDHEKEIKNYLVYFGGSSIILWYKRNIFLLYRGNSRNT